MQGTLTFVGFDIPQGRRLLYRVVRCIEAPDIVLQFPLSSVQFVDLF